MEEKLSPIAKTLKPSPIQRLAYLAERSNAVNLAQGSPDFPAPSHIKAAAISAINSDFNQYRHVQGICDLLADKMKQMHGLDVDPLTEVAICCGQTEAFAATMFAILNPGDEVILFDPCFETYETSILMAGGVPVYVSLDPPRWTLDPVKLLNAFTSKTKALLLNSPHNPTGKVFTREELEIIAECCSAKDCIAITDEVYEHLVYDDEVHISLASLPGMQKRTIITSSMSKTYSVTGWRVGWAIGPSCIAQAISNICIKLSDCAPSPFQEAALAALTSPPEYYEPLTSVRIRSDQLSELGQLIPINRRFQDYKSKRDFVINLLSKVGFQIQFTPKASFSIFTALPETCKLTDVEFVEELIKQAGVVAIPGCIFFHTNLSVGCYHNRYIRFAFCKNAATLTSAASKLQQLVDASGRLTLL